jgi:hypothetical protein
MNSSASAVLASNGFVGLVLGHISLIGLVGPIGYISLDSFGLNG